MDVKEFLSFETMVTPKIIKIFYIVVAGLMALGTLIAAFGALFSGSFGTFLIALVAGIVGQVVFRMTCESMIIFFKLHGELVRTRQSVEGNRGE